MSNTKLVKELKIKEIENICNNTEGCADCPLLISSYNKELLKDSIMSIKNTDLTARILQSQKILNIIEERR